MKVGEIYWVDLPDSERNEQQGRRPAVILQEPGYGGSLPTVLVIPLSSSKGALRFPGTALVRATSVSGLRNDSVALVFQLRAIDRRRIASFIGCVSADEQIAIQDELRKLLGQ
jgi:mRNA interferase MazF